MNITSFLGSCLFACLLHISYGNYSELLFLFSFWLKWDLIVAVKKPKDWIYITLNYQGWQSVLFASSSVTAFFNILHFICVTISRYNQIKEECMIDSMLKTSRLISVRCFMDCLLFPQTHN